MNCRSKALLPISRARSNERKKKKAVRCSSYFYFYVFFDIVYIVCWPFALAPLHAVLLPSSSSSPSPFPSPSPSPLPTTWTMHMEDASDRTPLLPQTTNCISCPFPLLLYRFGINTIELVVNTMELVVWRKGNREVRETWCDGRAWIDGWMFRSCTESTKKKPISGFLFHSLNLSFTVNLS